MNVFIYRVGEFTLIAATLLLAELIYSLYRKGKNQRSEYWYCRKNNHLEKEARNFLYKKHFAILMEFRSKILTHSKESAAAASFWMIYSSRRENDSIYITVFFIVIMLITMFGFIRKT